MKLTRGESIKLGKAVAAYNREVTKAEKISEYLAPSKVTAKELKEYINTSKQLDKVISNLKSFETSKIIDNDKVQTNLWKVTSQPLARVLAEKTLTIKTKFFEDENANASQELKRIKELNLLHGYERKRKSKRIMQLANPNYIMSLAKQYKDNYLEAMKNFEGLKGYKEWEDFVKSLKPEEFYKYIQNRVTDGSASINSLDIFTIPYRNPEQKDMNNILEDWGLLGNEAA